MDQYATIDGFEKLSAQEVFNISAKHLLKQGKKSESARDGNCKYRGPEGRMCAAGPFLKDEHTYACENKTWGTLVAIRRVPPNNDRLICKLQHVHDHYCPEDWLVKLMELAIEHGLNIPEMES